MLILFQHCMTWQQDSRVREVALVPLETAVLPCRQPTARMHDKLNIFAGCRRAQTIGVAPLPAHILRRLPYRNPPTPPLGFWLLLLLCLSGAEQSLQGRNHRG